MADESKAWLWSAEHNEAVKVLEVQEIWGRQVYRVWVPSKDAVVRVASEQLTELKTSAAGTLERLLYTAAAARIIDAMAQEALLAPLQGNLIPLPHQIRALSRAMSADRIRFLLADEVGLGKTIEAGMVMRELKLRGLAERILVVVPKGLVTQWVQEMRTHFQETFHPILPGDLDALSRIEADDNAWRRFDQVVCPMDSVKPVAGRRGWSGEKLREYNRVRYEDLVAAGWDLIIIDEAHRLGGSTDMVARYRLGEGLSQAAPYLLLLSATPHQGKTEQFYRVMSLLDRDAFPDVRSIKQERVMPFVIRTEKRRAVNAEGKPLFKPRRTQLVPVAWEEKHADQQRLYEAVTEYVRSGYNQAIREKRNYIGFLMILMQRLVTSSTRAIRTALEKRLAVIEDQEAKTSALRDQEIDPEWWDSDAQQQLDILLNERLGGLQNENLELNALLSLARQCEVASPDARAEALLEWMYRLQQEENDPGLKFLVFTEFVPSQTMLKEFLEARGFSAVRINGSMSVEDRLDSQLRFAEDARVLISTDAGGEGINLQFCHVVINYDLPWNPMKIEQRIGRVDRIGQKKIVRVINLVLQDTVEHRVQEVLEEKLAIILEEYGVDKASDVLDCAEAEEEFERLYIGALLEPEAVDAKIEELSRRIRENADGVNSVRAILGDEDPIDPAMASKLAEHPLPYWVEQMTLHYLKCEGGEIAQSLFGYHLTWPDGTIVENVTFQVSNSDNPVVKHLTLDAPRIRSLTQQLPRAVPGQPILTVRISSLPDGVAGYWSLWRIALVTEARTEERVLPLFVHDNGRALAPTAKWIWDRFLQGDHELLLGESVTGAAADAILRNIEALAEKHGQNLFLELETEHRQRLTREREKMSYAFDARRQAVSRIGLPEVRRYRSRQLDKEQASAEERLKRQEQVLPELQPILIVRIE